jgi:hypothetical protein
MTDFIKQYRRTGKFSVQASIEKIFPLLCPKREEEWIPGWECEVIQSKSGYNEEGAIFKTEKAFGSELYWYTITFDINTGVVDFLISASSLFMFRFNILVRANENGCILTFTHTFTPLSDSGKLLIEQFKTEDFNSRLQKLSEFMTKYLDRDHITFSEI